MSQGSDVDSGSIGLGSRDSDPWIYKGAQFDTAGFKLKDHILLEWGTFQLKMRESEVSPKPMKIIHDVLESVEPLMILHI